MPPTHSEVLAAYRHLFKGLLHAVQYSKPARFVVQDRMRNAFRNSTSASFNAHRIERTLQFLDGAAKYKGLEHKILKNLMHVWWERKKLVKAHARPDVAPFRKTAYDEFDRTVDMLNETMGMCIK